MNISKAIFPCNFQIHSAPLVCIEKLLAARCSVMLESLYVKYDDVESIGSLVTLSGRWGARVMILYLKRLWGKGEGGGGGGS